ncbi:MULTISPECIES: hypothetical protein [unclassified Caballeronia]|jgi:hypothetical protein|uniref:hypothetical protein n=1 Tax=unclassified Caballeronia TaxID=2646786 RepID=UPI002029AD99|nr:MULTISPECIES: hypothetical protein [unclassified Caballeronia]
MEAEYEILYKGCTLSPIVIDDGEFYTAMVVVNTPNGDVRASGALGEFPCALSARQFAIAHGMAEVDRREPPVPDWPTHIKLRSVARPVRS